MELKPSGSVGLFERFDESAAKDLAESTYREEKLVLPGAYPLRVIQGQTAGGHDAMNVGMML